MLGTPAKVVPCMKKCGRDTRDRNRSPSRAWAGVRICGPCLVAMRKARL